MIGVIFICKNVPCTTNFFISTVFNHSPTEEMISQESVMDFFAILLYASLFQVIGQVINFVSWKFPISVAVKSSFLMTYSGIERRSNVYEWQLFSCKRCPHVH